MDTSQSLDSTRLNWVEGLVSLPALSVLPKQGVTHFDLNFTFSADDSVSLVSTINFVVKSCRSGSIPQSVGGCQMCVIGFYAKLGDTKCHSCIFGSACSGGEGFPGGMGIYAKPGFWQPFWQRKEARRQVLSSSFMPTFFVCPFMGACVNNSKCAIGYEGLLCGICAPDWQVSRSVCVPCIASSGPSHVLWGGVGFVLVICIAVLCYREFSLAHRIKTKLSAVAQQRLVDNIFIFLRTSNKEFVTVQNVQVSIFT